MKVVFNILTGKHKGKMLTLTDPVVAIGRDPDVQLRVNSTEVSRRHCEIHLRETGVIVKDLGSRNGTFINGDAIYGEAPLHPGDTLHVGSMVFELAGKRKKPAEPAPKPKKPPGSRAAIKAPTDDEVIDWLADDGTFTDSDTTIVTSADAKKLGLDDSAENTPIKPRSQSVNIRPVDPGSHAAEAAEIIRQYWANR